MSVYQLSRLLDINYNTIKNAIEYLISLRVVKVRKHYWKGKDIFLLENTKVAKVLKSNNEIQFKLNDVIKNERKKWKQREEIE